MSRHNLTEKEWKAIRGFLPKERSGRSGRPWNPHRQVINGIIFVLRTGTGWRDLPEEFGKWSTVYKRFRRWVDQGLWTRIVSKVVKRLCANGEIDFELWCVDGTLIRAHRVASGARRNGLTAEENAKINALGRSRGGYSTKLHLLTDGQGTPLGVTATPGQRNEGPEFANLLESTSISTFRLAQRPKALAGDRAYNSAAIREHISKRGINPVIPTRSSEASDPNFDKDLYRRRNIIERAIGWLKENRRIATRYEKRIENYLAMIDIAIFRQLVNRD